MGLSYRLWRVLFWHLRVLVEAASQSLIFCVGLKVREATSNDPWGPSSSLMSEIADLTYNVVAFSEIMSMVWKRLNDHGKNWRHVYKVGAFIYVELVQVRENIFMSESCSFKCSSSQWYSDLFFIYL